MHFTEKDKLLLFRRDIKYVRAIAKSPVHITKETTAALLERLKLKPIVEVTPNNQVVGTVVAPSGTTKHACPECGIYFPSRHILKIHHDANMAAVLADK